MARCTAPVRGHRSASAAADCPACGSRYGRYSSYGSHLARPTPRREVAGAAGAAAAGPAAAQGRAGREPVRPWRTRLPRCGHSRRSAAASKSERACLSFGTSFSAMRGTTGEGSPSSCTRGQPPARLAKRPEHCRSADGRRRGQARRAGRQLVTTNARLFRISMD
jgi:hypothetical protein